MSLASWIKPYEEYLELEYLARNPNPKLISYLKGNEHMIDWSNLSANPNAIDMFWNTNRINWKKICLNPHPKAIELIYKKHEENMAKYKRQRRICEYSILSWENLSQNPSAVEFLTENPYNVCSWFQELPYEPNEDDYDFVSQYSVNECDEDRINWSWLSANPNALSLLKENKDMIDWLWLSTNPSSTAIKLLKNNKKNIDWSWLSTNPKAIKLLEGNQDKIDWLQLCKNPNAIHLIKENTLDIDWCYLSANPNAIEILEQYREKLDWRWLCKNPNAAFYLEENIEKQFDKLDWRWLSENPCIFE
jgi:hypothetical protein|uniref:Periplasmic copper-binding protein NosD beta helix domain-containing protein n=1 Tax=viral metagenome TaxID=1070528 RepID=A0A6C0LQ04_9ZZZZ